MKLMDKLYRKVYVHNKSRNKIVFILLLFVLNVVNAGATQIDSLQIVLKNFDGIKKVDALLSLAKSHDVDSNNETTAYYEKALELAISLNYKYGEGLADFYLGKIYRESDKFDKAIKYQQRALELFEDDQNDTMIVQVQVELGLTYFMKPEIEKAINHFNQALDSYRQLNDSLGISIAYYNLGRCYRKAGKLDLALDNSLKSLRFHEKNNHNSLNTISIIYAMMGKFDDALENQKKALIIREKLGLQEEIIGSLNNLGLISIRSKKIEQGLEYLLKSAKIAEEIGKKSQLNRTLNNIGFLYEEHLNQPEKALQYYKRSLKISEEIKESYEAANTLINIGILQSKLKQYNSALVHLEKGLNLAKEIKANDLIKNAYISLSQHYERVGNYKQAFKNYKDFIAIKDSLSGNESKDKITEMQIKYESEKKEKENQTYKLLLETAQSEKLLLLIGLLGLIIISLFIYYFYWAKKKTSHLLEERVAEQTYELQQRLDELLLTEKALKDNEEKYISLIESSSDPIFVLNRNLEFEYVNKVKLLQLGVTAESQAFGYKYQEFSSEKEDELFIEKINYVFNTGKPLEYEFFRRKDGAFILKTINPVLNTKNNEISAVTIIEKDISEFKQTQMEIEKKSISLKKELLKSEKQRMANLVLLNDYNQITKDLKLEISERKDAQNEIKKSHEELHELYKHLDNVIEKERTSISREIHDELGQSLTVLKFDLESLLPNQDNKPLIVQKTNSMLKIVSDTIKNVQRISSDLRPAMLDDIGLTSAIDWYCSDFETRTGINCLADLENIESSNPEINLAVFRILQESLTNILRHAKAKNINVKLGCKNNEISLEIHDDGIGLAEEKIQHKSSLGLIGMRERAKQIGGRFLIISEPGNGTTINVSIPINS